MTNLTPQEKINIYKNLFKGREDVFALRWEKMDSSASGYTPVCLNEWKQDICLKLTRKKCRNCKNQNYASFTENYIEQHLRGYKTYGIYPLLDDNTSYFLAADFDGKNWQKDALKYYQKCKSYKLPAYIEKSRSGQGGHVWLFFQNKCPAHKSRNIAVNILQEVNIVDKFAKEDSFDRLFPNQEVLSGKGFGNLISLPLQGKSREQNNTVFLNPENDLVPFADQWELLQKAEKISPQHLHELYEYFNQNDATAIITSKTKLTITIKNLIYINKNNLPRILINYLRDNLNFVNSDFIIKKKLGVGVYGMEKYFKLIETKDNTISIPRGFINNLINFLNQKTIKFKLFDQRNNCPPIDFESNCKLFDYQKEAIEDMLLSENGILVAPPGTGKTIMGIDLMAKLKQPALILVHKKQIFNQWLERIENFLNIPKREIGQLCSSKKKVGGKITVAMVQTLDRTKDLQEVTDKIGLIIVDECHHMPAKMFRNVITQFNPYYLYGLTATPTRKNNDEKLIFIYLGDILHSIDNVSNSKAKRAYVNQVNTKVIIRDTDLEVPFKIKTDNFQVLSKIIIYDSNRNKQIVDDAIAQVSQGSKCLVLTERKEHIEVLNYYLKREYSTITLTGDLTEKQRKEKIKQIEAGDFQILLATGQLVGEGTDFPKLNCLFLVYPFAFQGKLIQYIGRIQRGEDIRNTIYDYRDIKIPYLEKFFKKRLSYYKKNFDSKLEI